MTVTRIHQKPLPPLKPNPKMSMPWKETVGADLVEATEAIVQQYE